MKLFRGTLKEILKLETGYGYGYGDETGNGTGTGIGIGTGNGYGYGYGSGYGNGNGNGYRTGYETETKELINSNAIEILKECKCLQTN